MIRGVGLREGGRPLDNAPQTGHRIKKAVAQLVTRRAAPASERRESPISAEEWLGGESHVPNLRRELRQRNAPAWDMTVAWFAGALFVAGVAVGSLASLVLTRARKTNR